MSATINVDVPALLERLGIKAKRKGRELWACCPFHEERTPSWQMRDDDADLEKHARWRCLGKCHDGGSAVGLVMRLLGFERAREAIAWLRSGLAVDVESLGSRMLGAGLLELAEARRPTVGAFKLPSSVRFAPFSEWPETARTYAESRGLDDAQVERWGLGFAIDGRLAGRVVLPWRDGKGRIGGYTARAYVPGEKKKHLEPGEPEHAAKGWVYGEERWPPPEKRGVCVVVEGAFDGFAIERASSLPFGACRGSNFALGHAARLSTFEELIFAGDPDGAGQRFGDELTSALGRHVTVKRATFPEGFDAAKLERRAGPRALNVVLRAAR